MPQSDQPQGVSTTVELTVVPIPPRYWWLKRIALAGVLLFVALFVLRSWWGWETRRRFQAEIDRIIAAGEPIYPEDFDPKEDIPDDQNAARFLLQAENAIDLTAEQAKFVDDPLFKIAELPERLGELRAIMEPNAAAFELVRRARGASDVDWGLRFRTPAFNTMLPMIPGQRRLGKLINVAAYYHHGTGRDDQAVESLRDAVYQSKTVSSQHILVAQFQMMATQSTTARTIEETGSTLRAAAGDSAGPLDGGSATREQVEGLMHDLLDDEWYRLSMTGVMLGERMMALDTVRQTAEGNMSIAAAAGFAAPATPAPWIIRLSQYPIAPLLYLEGLAVLRDYNRCVRLSARPDWPSVASELPSGEREATILEFLSSPFRRGEFARMNWIFAMHFRALAMRRMAAVALAIRLYEVDHGKRPSVLTDLTPEYLEFVPADPFAPDGRAIAYLPHTRRPMLYCIGKDGIDNQGAFTFHGDRIDPEQLDLVFFLDGNRPQRREDLDQAPPESLLETGHDSNHAAHDDKKDDEDKESQQSP